MYNTKLRAIVITIEAQLSELSTLPSGEIPSSSIAELQRWWGQLVTYLDLGPEPAVRSCPTCNNIVMLVATRCGRCWAKLRPPAPNVA